jgi:hypothetical protein
MSQKPLQLPADLARTLSEYMKPEDVAAATLVDTPTDTPTNGPPASDPWQANKQTIYVSYIPALRSFSAQGSTWARYGQARYQNYWRGLRSSGRKWNSSWC